jgi:cyclophilin family peptidyl-prolyl cis-trans isomerase
MKQRKILCLLLCAALVLLLAACGKPAQTPDTTAAPENTSGSTEAQPEQNDTKENTTMEHKKVKFTMENGGTFTIELYPEYAPQTVANFLKLAESNYYAGTTFHRVYPGFMAQGGEGADTPTIKGEFASNGFSQNTLSHTRGVVSMARTSVKDSASSQFFICYDDVSYSLDGDYAAFGKVVDGMDTVDAFCEIEREYNGFDRVPTAPVEPIVIKSCEIVD